MWWLGGLALVIVLIRLLRRRPKVSGQHHRGRKWQKVVAPILDPGDMGFQLINHRFPTRIASGHLAVIGATGSGKTLIQRMLWQSVIPNLGPNQRALIYDAKQDTCALLKGMGVTPVLLNPLDARSVGWNLAADITTPASALQVASLLIPETNQDANPFFTNASRLLLYGAILALICRSPGNWTFRQLLLLLRDSFRLKQALAATPHTAYLVQYFEHEATFQNILSTLLTYTVPYEIIAAAWDKAPAQISLSQWKGSVLVLGNDERNRSAIDTLNRLLFQRLTELILAGPESPSVTTWLFLDEVREAGKLTGLSRLLTKGRSKGAAVVLGFQDISGLRDVYGRQVADELLGQCNTKVCLRLNSPETAAWAEKVFGCEEVIETRRGDARRSDDPFNTSENRSHGRATRPLVMESEFLSLPETTPTNGLTGYVVSPSTGPYRTHVTGDWLRRNLVPPVADSLPRDTNQFLAPWDARDRPLSVALTPGAAKPTVPPDPEPDPTLNPAQRADTPHALNCVLPAKTPKTPGGSPVVGLQTH